tara:strand:+ start:814 stop:3270 length:2457 start_codon:yes stop_codon:yes gene_type:complete
MTTPPKWARLGPLYVSQQQAEQAEKEGRAIRVFPEGFEAMSEYRLPGVGEIPKSASAKMMGTRMSEVGTFPTSGVVDMDANPRLPPDVWRGFQTQIGIVDQMRQEDPIIKAITLAFCLPIIRSHWKVEPGGDDRPALEEAEFIRANFFEYLKGGFYQFVEQAAAAVWRGFSLFEIVARFDRETKQVRLDQLSPMLPRTIYQWTRYPDAGWGCTQTSYTGDPDIGRNSSLSDLGPSLPPEKLLHFVFDPDGDAPEGTSILRPCYGGWKARRLYLKLEASGYERAAFGVPYVELSPTARAGDSAAVNSILRELRTGARAWASFPPGYTLKFADFPMKGADIREARRALGQDMARAALTPFLTTGDGKVGSFALIAGQQDFFTMTLQSVADMIGKVLSHGSNSLVQRLCMWNYDRSSGFPKIVPGSISIGDPKALVDAIAVAATSGSLIPDRGIEESVRAALGLPEMPEAESKEEMEHRLKNSNPPEVKPPEAEGEVMPRVEPEAQKTTPKVREVTDDQADKAEAEADKMEALAELPGRRAMSGRDLKPYEMVVRLDETLAPMQGAKEAMAQAAVNWRQDIAEKYAQRVSRAGDLIEMRSVDVPDVGKLKEMFKAELRKVYRSGQAAVREEMDRMEAAPDLARAVEDGDFETTRDGIVVESPEEVRVLQEPHKCCPHESLQETKPGSKADDADQSTPAAPDERRTGSKKNEPGSASTEGKGIDLSKATELALERKVEEHNEAVGDDKSKRATIRMLKVVYRRGSGAFSTSHRPGMSRGQWSMGRVNAFLKLLRAGRPADAKYITDNDLLPKGHPKAKKDEE